MNSEIIQKYREGDHAAFNQIMLEYQQPIYFYILRMVGNPGDAEDLTQEAFVKVYTERQNFRGDSAINTWIYRIATNLTRNFLRWRSIRKFVTLDSTRDSLFDAADELQKETREEREKVLLKHLQNISDKQRSVFVLKYFNELSHQEIARILNISEGSSKTNFHYAVKSLKALIQEDHHE